MSSSSRKKTTFAKLAREQKLRERRRDKQAKKDARKLVAQEEPTWPIDAAHHDVPPSVSKTEPS